MQYAVIEHRAVDPEKVKDLGDIMNKMSEWIAHIKDLQKKIEKAAGVKDGGNIAELLKSYQQKVDKAIKTGWLKKNTGNRKKSRLTIRAKKSLAK